MGWNDVKENNGGSEKKEVNFVSIADKETVVLRVLSEEPISRWSHWIPSVKRSFTCLGKGCPVCEIIKQDKANKANARYSSSKRHSLIVWNYATKRVEVLEQGNDFFQNLLAFVEDPDLGDLRDYDIKITRRGTGKDTSYTVIPCAKKRVSKEVEDAFATCGIDLEKYYAPCTSQQMIDILSGKPIEEVFAQTTEDLTTDSDLLDFETE